MQAERDTLKSGALAIYDDSFRRLFLVRKKIALLYAQVYQEKLDQFEEEEQKLDDEFMQRLKSQDRLLSEARERLRTSPEYEGIPDYLFEEKLRQIESENTKRRSEPEVYQYPSFDKLASDVEEIVDSKLTTEEY